MINDAPAGAYTCPIPDCTARTCAADCRTVSPNVLRAAAGLDSLPETVFGMTREEFEGFLGNPHLEDWQWKLLVRLKDM